MPLVIIGDKDMAKQKAVPEKSITRKEIVHHKRDEKLQRILTWSAAGIGALIVLILGYGLLAELVFKPAQPVATVGDTKITVEEYQARVRYERGMIRNYTIPRLQWELANLDTSDEFGQFMAEQYQAYVDNLEQQLGADLATTIGGQFLDQMIEEELIRQEAAQRNLIVSDDEVTQYIEQMMGYDREAEAQAAAVLTDTETLTETAAVTDVQSSDVMTEGTYLKEYAGFKANLLDANGFSEEAFRQTIETELLRTKLQEALSEGMETEAEQVTGTYLAVVTEEEALALQKRLQEGEDIDTVREELNGDDDDTSRGAALAWTPREGTLSQISTELEETAFTLPLGEVSDPISSTITSAYYLIQVDDRSVQPLSESLLEQKKEDLYAAWVTQQEEEKVKRLDYASVTPSEP